MRSLYIPLVLALLASPAMADPVACHVSITETTHRIDHHTTSCKAADDTKYDETTDVNVSVRIPCHIQMDDSSVSIEADESGEAAVGSMDTKQKNEGVFGSHATSSFTFSGHPTGSIILMQQPTGNLLA